MSESLFDKVLQTEAEKRNLSKKDLSRLRNWALNVGHIESDNNYTRTQNDDPEGIGRGKYQFENSKGSGTAKTAANRIQNWEKINGSLDISKEDRAELSKEDPDFSKLSEDVQDAAFIIHHSLHPGTPLTQIAKGSFPQAEAWVRYHWAGPETDAQSKYDMWNKRIDAPIRAATAGTFPEAMQ